MEPVHVCTAVKRSDQTTTDRQLPAGSLQELRSNCSVVSAGLSLSRGEPVAGGIGGGRGGVY